MHNYRETSLLRTKTGVFHFLATAGPGWLILLYLAMSDEPLSLPSSTYKARYCWVTNKGSHFHYGLPSTRNSLCLKLNLESPSWHQNASEATVSWQLPF